MGDGAIDIGETSIKLGDEVSTGARKSKAVFRQEKIPGKEVRGGDSVGFQKFVALF